MIFRTVYDGLKYIYQGYFASHNFGLHPAYGYLEAGKPVSIYCPDTLVANIHYTRDGTRPTRRSERLNQDTMVIDRPTELHFTSFANKPEYDTMVSAHFQSSPGLKPLSLPKDKRAGGLHYAIYEGISQSQSSPATPVAAGIADSSFSMQKVEMTTPFTCIMRGYFEARTEGYYMFAFDRVGDIKFSLGGHTLLNYPLPGASSVLVPLKKGFYPIRLTYFHRTGEKKLDVYFEAPENVKIDRAGPLPLNLFYH